MAQGTIDVARRAAKFLVRNAYLKPTNKYHYNKYLKKNSKPYSGDFAYKPKISIIVPTYNTPRNFFIEMIESVIGQQYSNWELVLVDDASPDESVRALIKSYSEKDERITYKFLKNNLHISGATNEGIKIATGEFISLFDHDDILYPETLFEVVKALNQGDYDFIYTDEDKITEDKNNRYDPFFKPKWSQDFIYSVNPVTHFATIRKSILDKCGYEDGEYNGAQDWELFLRVARTVPESKIHHIPKILYSWRVHSDSTAKSVDAKPYVVEAQRKAITNDLIARRYNNFDLKRDEKYPGQWHLSFLAKTTPKVTVVINSEIEAQVRAEIQRKTNYKNYECITNEKNDVKSLQEKIQGKHVVFIDKKIKIKNSNWIQDLLGDSERKDIGFVLTNVGSRRKVYELIVDLLGKERASLIRKMKWRGVSGHYYRTTRYNLPKVQEGICMVEWAKLQGVIGTKKQPPTFSQWSSKLSEKGYRNLYNPYIKMVK